MTVFDVKLPQYGMGTNEAVVVEWLKAVGDSVLEGEPLVEIETAKTAETLEAPVAGTLIEIAAEPDSEVPVGEVIARIEQMGS